MTTSKRIKKIRLEKGLTQKQLGDLCSIDEANIRKYELGNANPKIETIKKIANALGVPYTDLLDDFPIDEVITSFNTFADEISKKRNIYDIEQRLKKLGYYINITSDEKVHTSVITTDDGFKMSITDEELQMLEKDTDEYLKFKLLELKKKK